MPTGPPKLIRNVTSYLRDVWRTARHKLQTLVKRKSTAPRPPAIDTGESVTRENMPDIGKPEKPCAAVETWENEGGFQSSLFVQRTEHGAGQPESDGSKAMRR